MKTVNKTCQQIANIVIVQFETLTEDGFGFLPAGPSIEAGDLVIKELDHSGDVNNLLAINKTGNHYLLTDMDLLKGARQNRVVNISTLVMPHEQRKINVSCVERSRWSYHSPQFKPGKRSMEASFRIKKIEALKRDQKEKTNQTQLDIWENISIQMFRDDIFSPTEDYNSILEEAERRRDKNICFNRSDSSNAVAIFEGQKLAGFDLFGNRLSYAYYFDMLQKDALGRIKDEEAKSAIGQAEAFYRLDAFLDQFEGGLEEQTEPLSSAESKLKWSGIENIPGFALEYKDNMIHMAGFLRI